MYLSVNLDEHIKQAIQLTAIHNNQSRTKQTCPEDIELLSLLKQKKIMTIVYRLSVKFVLQVEIINLHFSEECQKYGKLNGKFLIDIKETSNINV